MHDSQQLLAEYAASGSESVFSELVGRYIDLVYSTAVRLLEDDSHLAKDATQLVFVSLAGKARTLPGDVQLGGWLHRTTCFVVANLRRTERRRQSRERKAVAMNLMEDHSAANLAQVWPLLDEAINKLGAEDRIAILLRYFEQRDFVAVGAALGSSEGAAQKRVTRALERLRTLLLRRGVSLSVALLGTVLASGVVSAAPSGLAATVSSASLHSASAATGTISSLAALGKLKLAILSTIVVGSLAILPVMQFLANNGTILFGGQHWHPWRTLFTVQGDKLVSLPKARPKFKYGSNGGGRGPELFCGIDDRNWRDYRAEFEYCVTGIDPEFNPYGLPLDYHDGDICFHVADAKESWNERGASMYALDVAGDGSWKLHCIYNSYCAVRSGFGRPRSDATRTLAEGSGLAIDRVNGNKYAIELRGNRIQIWVDGAQIADVTDDKMGNTIGGQTLDHGGVGFIWGYDAMGWIRNFSMKPL